MKPNPYEAPQTILEPTTVNQPAGTVVAIDVQKIRRVARGQRWILFLILVHLAYFIGMALLPKMQIVPSNRVLGLLFLTMGLVSICVMYHVAKEVYHKFLAFLLSLGGFTPIFALLVMAMIFSQSTQFLRSHNIKVGFFGGTQEDF